MNLQTAQKYVTAPNYQVIPLHQKGTTQDIMREMVQVWQEDNAQVKRLAKFFQANTIKQTAQNVWDFLRKNVKYVPDSLKEMLIKTPSRLIYDGFGDCKGYSIFIKSVLDNLGIGNFFRFVGYNKDKEATHVYVVAIDENGNHIPIDACIDKFNYELPYKPSTKKDMAGTAITKINGTQPAYDQYHSYIMCPCKDSGNNAMRIGIGYAGDFQIADFEKREMPALSLDKKFSWESVDGIVDLIGKGVNVIKEGAGVVKDIFGGGKIPADGYSSGGLTVNNPLPRTDTQTTGNDVAKTDNTMMYVLGGLGLFLLLSGGGGKKKSK